MTLPVFLAPMEGLTNSIYRRAHARAFPGLAGYYSPFITPNSSKKLTTRELSDILPENNPGQALVPQILTSRAEDFLWCAGKLRSFGYEEVNLNLGCPSGTVVSKGRGAGFLARREELERFLDEIFSQAPCRVSIKTRVGLESAEEFPALLGLFRRYPLSRLIVHPRTRTQFYKGEPRRECFRAALEGSPFPVVYNGDLFCVKDVRAFGEEYPAAAGVMCGRGLIADPGLERRLAGEEPGRERYRAFIDEVLEGYLAVWRDKRAVVAHMKEVWCYMISLFPDSRRHAKAIRKANTVEDYRAAVEALFAEREVAPLDEWSFGRLGG